MNITDKNLSRIIKVKLCTDDISDIEDIEEICIQDINLMQRKLNIDLTEITKLKNLKSLSLKFFDITDDIIESINNLDYIEELELSMCCLKSKKKIIKDLKSLTIYNCENFDINLFEMSNSVEELEIIHSGIIRINELERFKNLRILRLSDCSIISIPRISVFQNLEKLFINNTEIKYDIDISNMKNLIFISLNGSKVDNKDEYVKKLLRQKLKLDVEFKDDNLPTV